MVKDSNSQPSLNFVYIPIFKFQLTVPFVNTVYFSVSQSFLPRGTLGQQYHYLVAPIDAKIGLKVNKSDN